jgi:dihydrofolate reductase
MEKKISLIVATSKNNVIAKNGTIPWHCSEDMKFFKRMTTENSIVMGRKTWDTLGRPLKNRENIVITRNNNVTGDVIVVNSLEEAFLKATHNIFVIGGGEIYNQSIPYVSTIYRSLIDIEIPDGDVFFPDINEDEFELINSENVNDEIPFIIQTWERKI